MTIYWSSTRNNCCYSISNFCWYNIHHKYNFSTLDHWSISNAFGFLTNTCARILTKIFFALMIIFTFRLTCIIIPFLIWITCCTFTFMSFVSFGTYIFEDKTLQLRVHLPKLIMNVQYLRLTGFTGLSRNGVWSHSHAPTHVSIYLGVLLPHVQNFIYDKFIAHQHFSRCSQLSFCKKFICNFMLSRVSIRRNPLYYIVFGSKHISVRDAQKQFKLV